MWLKLNHQRLEHIIGIASESLPHFGFPEFNENFIERFKKEIPKIVDKAVNFDFNWETVKPSPQFKSRLEKKKREAVDMKISVETGRKMQEKRHVEFGSGGNLLLLKIRFWNSLAFHRH